MAETPNPPRRRLAVWPLVLTWIAVPFHCTLVAIPITAFHVLHSFLGRRRFAFLSVVAAPIFVMSAWTAAGAVAGYVSGTARLHYAGLPDRTFYSLDPDVRCYRRTSGCVTFPDTDFYHEVNNVVLRGLVKRCGPMKGAWAGSYPGPAEAFAALAKPEGTVELKGRRVEDAWEEFGFPVNSAVSESNERLLHNLRSDSVPWSSIAGDVVVLGSTSGAGKTTAVLVARPSGEAFAVYEKWDEK